MPTFEDNLDRFLGVTGMRDGDIAWYLAQYPFVDDTERDAFITDLSGGRTPR